MHAAIHFSTTIQLDSTGTPGSPERQRLDLQLCWVLGFEIAAAPHKHVSVLVLAEKLHIQPVCTFGYENETRPRRMMTVIK
jgi:hypothetical protein